MKINKWYKIYVLEQCEYKVLCQLQSLGYTAFIPTKEVIIQFKACKEIIECGIIYAELAENSKEYIIALPFITNLEEISPFELPWQVS